MTAAGSSCAASRKKASEDEDGGGLRRPRPASDDGDGAGKSAVVAKRRAAAPVHEESAEPSESTGPGTALELGLGGMALFRTLEWTSDAKGQLGSYNAEARTGGGPVARVLSGGLRDRRVRLEHRPLRPLRSRFRRHLGDGERRHQLPGLRGRPQAARPARDPHALRHGRLRRAAVRAHAHGNVPGSARDGLLIRAHRPRHADPALAPPRPRRGGGVPDRHQRGIGAEPARVAELLSRRRRPTPSRGGVARDPASPAGLASAWAATSGSTASACTRRAPPRR